MTLDCTSDNNTFCHQEWQELRNYRKIATLTVTCEDAKAYMYSLSRKRRAHRWTDIRVNLYILQSRPSSSEPGRFLFAAYSTNRPCFGTMTMHREYLKDYHPVRYTCLILSCELWTYLADLNEQAALLIFTSAWIIYKNHAFREKGYLKFYLTLVEEFTGGW